MKRIIFFLSVIVVVFFTACTHEPFKFIGGKGGAATIVVYPKHHTVTATLDSMMVYIKYNTLDAPSNGVYDDSAACTYINSLPSCSFSGLKNGDYYLYAKGYDYDVAARVKGGAPYSITLQQSQNLTLQVGEE
jgi:hypothetical protein